MKPIDTPALSSATRDHATHPWNQGPLAEYDAHSRNTGPCGDTMEVWLVVSNGSITKASFDTDGCWPAVASGSVVTSLATGRSLGSAAALQQEDVLEALGGLPEEYEHWSIMLQDCFDSFDLAPTLWFASDPDNEGRLA